MKNFKIVYHDKNINRKEFTVEAHDKQDALEIFFIARRGKKMWSMYEILEDGTEVCVGMVD